MKIPYIKIPITDLSAYLAPCSAQEKGVIFQAILDFGMYQQWPTLDVPTPVYQAVQEIIAREIKSYKKFCAQQRKRIKTYWENSLNADDTNVVEARNNQTKQKQELKQEQENISIFAASDSPVQQADKSSLLFKKQKPKTTLQVFSNYVLANFEPDVKTDAQKSVWFRRNCRSLRDILSFCGQDIKLALQTIHVCLERWEKAGFSGGYDAICRNLPEYCAKAQTQMEDSPYGDLKA